MVTQSGIETTDDAVLRSMGLSRAKIASLRDLCLRLADGRLNFDLLTDASDYEAIKMLDDVRGIGAWTAQMALMFALGRMDILPATDIGVQRGIMRAYQLVAMPSPSTVQRIAAERGWSPYSSIACWYLWCVAEPEGNALW